MFWADLGTNTIDTAPLSGLPSYTLVDDSLVNPYGLAIDPLRGYLYWTEVNGNQLKRSHLDGSNVTVLVETGLRPSYICLDLLRGHIYWTENGDGGNDSIWRAQMDGTGAEVVTTTGFTGILGLAIDSDRNRLYWTDRGIHSDEASMIGYYDLDTDTNHVLLTELNSVLDEPAGIALDLEAEPAKMYWADNGDEDAPPGWIYRANLDGTNIEMLVDGLSAPHGVALDLRGGRMYWTDFGSGLVQSATLEGDDIRDVALANGPRAIALIPGTHDLAPCPGDMDGDGDIDQADLGALLAVYGQTCQ